MKFLVRLPNGAESEHELLPSAVVGRDKASGLVLDDNRCSRKHATLEADGVTFRDMNSANGMFVNGQRIQAAALKAGDIVLLGGTTLTVLPDEESGTLQMSADEVAASISEPPPPVPPAPAPAPAAGPTARTYTDAPQPEPTLVARAAAPAAPPAAPVPAAPPPAAPSPLALPEAPARAARPEPIDRPFTVTLLALGWAASAVLVLAAGLLAMLRGFPLALLVAVPLGIVSALLAIGLLRRAAWARFGQLAAAAVGMFTPLILPSAAIIYYMMRDDVTLAFARRDWSELSADETEILRTEPREATFITLIAASAAFSVLVALAVAFALRGV